MCWALRIVRAFKIWLGQNPMNSDENGSLSEKTWYPRWESRRGREHGPNSVEDLGDIECFSVTIECGRCGIWNESQWIAVERRSESVLTVVLSNNERSWSRLTVLNALDTTNVGGIGRKLFVWEGSSPLRIGRITIFQRVEIFKDNGRRKTGGYFGVF